MKDKRVCLSTRVCWRRGGGGGFDPSLRAACTGGRVLSPGMFHATSGRSDSLLLAGVFEPSVADISHGRGKWSRPSSTHWAGRDSRRAKMC